MNWLPGLLQPELQLIGYIEATCENPVMTPRQKVRQIARKIREYDAEMNRRQLEYQATSAKK